MRRFRKSLPRLFNAKRKRTWDRHGPKGAHARAAAVARWKAAGQRPQRNEEEPQRLPGTLPPVSLRDRIAQHMPMRCEVRKHIGLAQNMLPFQRAPRGRLIAESSCVSKSGHLLGQQRRGRGPWQDIGRRIGRHFGSPLPRDPLLHPVVDTGSSPPVAARNGARNCSNRNGAPAHCLADDSGP